MFQSYIGRVGPVPPTIPGTEIYDTIQTNNLHAEGNVYLQNVVTDNLLVKVAPVTVLDPVNYTYTAPQIISGLIKRNPSGAPRVDVTPSASSIISELVAISPTNIITNYSFLLTIDNISATIGETVSLTGGTGVTIENPITIDPLSSVSLQFIVTQSTLGLEAISVFNLSGPPIPAITPGGANTYIQFNDSGVFGGSSNLTFDKLTNTVTLAGTLTGIATPFNSTDATNKTYVDNAITGLRWLNPVTLATTGNLASLSGLLTIDGVAAVAGNRILVKDQTTGTQNGIYVAAAGAWARSSDMALGSDAAAASMYVAQGTVNGTYAFTCTNVTGSAVVGTNPLTFIIFNNSGKGDVIGPVSATNNAVARYDTTTGKLIKNSGILVSDTQDLSGVRTLALQDATVNTLTVKPATTTTSYTITMPGAQGAASTYLQNNGSGTLTWATAGDVFGPASSTNTALALYNGTTGKAIQNSVVTVTSGGGMAGVASLGLKGTTNSVTVQPAAATAAYALTLPGAQGAASTYLQNNGSGTLTWATAGDVFGPGSATSTAIALYSGTTGKAIQNSVVTITGGGGVAGVASLGLKGTTNSVTVQPAAATAAYALTLPGSQGAASTYLQNNGSGTLAWATAGDVFGPGSATSTAIALYSGATGKVIQNSVVTITGGGGMAGVASLGLKGTTNSVTVQPAAATAAYGLTLPGAQGAASTYLKNDGSGTLAWATAGDVTGPASSTDTSLALFSGTTGKVVQNSVVTVTSGGSVAGVASLGLKGTTNSVTVQPAAATAAYGLTLPGSQGASNTFLRNDGSGGLTWANVGIVAGANTNVQFNDAGSLGGVSAFSYDKTLNILTVGTVTGLSNPTNSTDAANKQYVDNISTGLKYKSPVNVATTGDITPLSGLITVDGVTLVIGDRVLVKNQTTGTQNGLYIVNGAGAWSRTSDLPVGSDASGVVVFVISGSTNGGYSFICNNAAGSAVVGTNSLTFVTYTTGQNGNVQGPVSATNNAIARYDASTGKIIKNSGILVSDTQDLSGAKSISLLDATTGTLTMKPATATTTYTVTMPPTQGSAGTFLSNDGSGTLSWSTSGNVVGPISATNNALARYDLTTGKLIKDSIATLSNTGDLAGLKTIAVDGSLSGTLTVRPAPSTTSYTLTMPSLQGASGTYLQNNGSGTLTWATAGDVAGPASSTTNAIPTYTDTTGKVLGNSSLLFSSGNLYGAKSITMLDSAAGNLTITPSASTTSYTLTMPAAQGATNSFLRNDGSGTLTWSAAGTVTGPLASTDTAIPRFSGTSGQVIQNSGVTINSTNDIAGAGSLSLAGTSNSVKVMPASSTAAYSITLPSAQGAASTFLQNDGSGTLTWGNTAPLATSLGGTSAFTVPYQSASQTTSYLTFQQLNALLVAPPTLGSGTLTIYVNNYWGSDSNNGTTQQTAVATLGKALTLVTTGGIINILGSSTAYNENLTITTPNVTIMSDSYNNLIVLSGTLTISNTSGFVSMKGVSIANIVHNSSGSLYLNNCFVTSSLVTSSTGAFRAIQTDIQNSGTATVSVTGAGTKIFGSDCYMGNTTINNSSAIVRITNVTSCLRITLIAGTLMLSDSTVYSPSNLLSALTASSGSLVYIDNTKFLLTGTTSPAPIDIAVGALYSEMNSNRTLSSSVLGSNIYRISYSDANYAQNYFIKGSTSGHVNLVAPATPSSYNIIFPSAQGAANTTLINNGSGTLSWGSQSIANTRTYYVSGFSGSDTNDGLSPSTAYATISKALTVVVSGCVIKVFTNTASDYAETLNITTPNITLMSDAGITNPFINGTVTVNNASGTVSIKGFKIDILNFTGAGKLECQNITVLSGFNSTATGNIKVSNSDLSSGGNNALSLTGTGTVEIQTSEVSDMFLLNGTVKYFNSNCLVQTISSGTLYLSDCTCYAPNAGTDALTVFSTGTCIMDNVKFWVTGTSTASPAAIRTYAGSFYSENNVQRSLSSIMQGTNVYRIQTFDGLYTQNTYLKGTTSGTVNLATPATITSYTITLPSAQGAANTTLINNGSGALTWGVSGSVTGPLTSTDTALVRFSGTSGSVLQDSTVLVSGVGAMTGVTSLALKGTTNSVTITPAAATAAYSLTLPSAQGAANSVLQNNGSGTLTWGTAGTGNVVCNTTPVIDTQIPVFSGTTGTLLTSSSIQIDASRNISKINSLKLDGATSGTLTLQAAASTTSHTLTFPAAQGSAATYLRNNGSGGLTWATAGDVFGPGSSATNNVALYADNTGKLLKDSSSLQYNPTTYSLSGMRDVTISDPASANTMAIAYNGTNLTLNNVAVQNATYVPDYAYVSQTSGITFNTGFNIVNIPLSSSNNIAYNSGVFTLNAGRTYRLVISGMRTYGGNDLGSIAFYDANTNVILPNANYGWFRVTNFPDLGDGMEMIYTPVTSKTIKVMTNVQGSAWTCPSLGIIVQQISSLEGNQNATYTVTTTGQTGSILDRTVLFNPPSSTAITFTLPSCVGEKTRIEYKIVQSVSAKNATVILTPQVGQTIDGSSTYTLSCAGDFVEVTPNGTDWTVTDKPSGLLLIENRTVSGATSVIFDNVFSSKYSNYVIDLYLVNSGGSGNFLNTWQLRSGGSTITSANYDLFYAFQGNSNGASGSYGITSWAPASFMNFVGSGDFVSNNFEIINPQSSTQITQIKGQANSTTNSLMYTYQYGGIYKVAATTADGWVYNNVSGTVSGYVKIYAKTL